MARLAGAGVSAGAIRRSPIQSGHVLASRLLTPRMRRLTVQAPSMAGVQPRPAQDVEVLLSSEDGRRVKRRYTIAEARPQSGEFELDVLVHGHGPGSRWAETAQAGDTVQFQGPRGKLELTSAEWHLLVGDESALPAIASICAALPDSEPALALVEVTDEQDELPIPGRVEVRWVHRRDTPPGGADLLTTALDGLNLPRGTGHGYLMGETRAMVALRSVLERRGLPHDAIFVKGYWNLGRPDRLAGRAPHPAQPRQGPS